MNPQAQPQLDELDLKLAQAFPGRVVRKDLVKRLKVGFAVPVYVLEYLLWTGILELSTSICRSSV